MLHQQDEREALRRGKRYMSNIAVVERQAELNALPRDELDTEPVAFIDDGHFTGRYLGPLRGEIQETFEHNLAQLFARAETPRLSGVQIKAPMNLGSDGELLPAIDLPFTHVLKPAGTAGFEMLPVVEWLCLNLVALRASRFRPPRLSTCRMGCRLHWSWNGSTCDAGLLIDATWRSRIFVRFSICRPPPNTTARSSVWRGVCGRFRPTLLPTSRLCSAARFSRG
ncbi:hypothetical protein MES5069_190038 [Mesorhizobium escarrei]|uniref:Uncharacterized protein n=1 Tax=Mesorhizobium escarrei TaxID=666018 RepID=A0ABN8JL30_9HYPH|nr:hypothetical protein MES5069_190038 [Mesorhizobium escarrei]